MGKHSGEATATVIFASPKGDPILEDFVIQDSKPVAKEVFPFVEKNDGKHAVPIHLNQLFKSKYTAVDNYGQNLVLYLFVSNVFQPFV